MTPERIAFGRQIFDYFVQRGLPPHQAAAIAGNMAWEGGGRADLVNPGDNWRNSPRSPHSVGIGQWNDRAPALIDFARSQGIELPEGDTRDVGYMRGVISRIPLQTQLAFAWNEMQGPEARAYRMISQGGDLRSATAGAISYHRPAGWSWGNPEGGHGFSNRLSLANSIMGGQSAPQMASASPPAPVSASPATPAPQQGEKPVFDVLASLFGKMAGPAQAGAQMASGPTMGPMPMGGGQGMSLGPLSVSGNADLAKDAVKSAGGAPEQSMLAGPSQPQRPVDLQQLMAVLGNRQKLGLG